MNRPRRIATISRVTAGMLLFAGGLTCGPTAVEAQLVTPMPDPTGLRFEAQVEASEWLLTVSGPSEFYLRQSFHETVPALDLSSYLEANPVDGIYVWELRASWPVTETTGSESKSDLRRDVQSGTFTILNGLVVPGSGSAEERAPAFDQKVTIIHNDDVIVQGRMCIGDDCTGAETMPIEAIKLKQNNNWIRFDDTSGTGFPDNDWQLRVNDSTAGASYFAIEDISGGTVPVKVEAGATTDSIRVDQNGRIGLGTATPSVRLHVAGNTFLDGDLAVTSSRAAKTDFDSVDVDRVLEKLGELPLHHWTYRADDSGARHLGPFAEDFRAAFGLGHTDTSVNPLDLAGVAMAAAQGLQARLEELRDLMALQRAEIDSLRRDRDVLLERLEALGVAIGSAMEEGRKGKSTEDLQ